MSPNLFFFLIFLAIVGVIGLFLYVAPTAFKKDPVRALLKQQSEALELAGKYSGSQPGLSEEYQAQAQLIGEQIRRYNK